ncbi:MAG: polynucleotide adenylyltransferase, partial [Lachnospiraceae bacterium]|nr:polynucleotide adenylyltransferase [Lachnospiraceae bacterium]
PDLTAIRYADTYAQSEYKREEKLAAIHHMERLYREILDGKDCMTVRELKLDGNDLKGMGVAPGRQMGAILNTLLDEVLEEPEKNNMAYLAERAKALMNMEKEK